MGSFRRAAGRKAGPRPRGWRAGGAEGVNAPGPPRPLPAPPPAAGKRKASAGARPGLRPRPPRPRPRPPSPGCGAQSCDPRAPLRRPGPGRHVSVVSGGPAGQPGGGGWAGGAGTRASPPPEAGGRPGDPGRPSGMGDAALGVLWPASVSRGRTGSRGGRRGCAAVRGAWTTGRRPRTPRARSSPAAPCFPAPGPRGAQTPRRDPEG